MVAMMNYATKVGGWTGQALIPATGWKAIYATLGPNDQVELWDVDVIAWALGHRLCQGDELECDLRGFSLDEGDQHPTDCREEHWPDFPHFLGYRQSANDLDRSFWERRARNHIPGCERLQAKRLGYEDTEPATVDGVAP
jgi:hypothetical protein